MSLEQNVEKIKLAISFDVEATSDSPATGSCINIGFACVREDAVPFAPYDKNAKYKDLLLMQRENAYSEEEGGKKGQKGREPWIMIKKAWFIKEYNGRGERCMKEFWSKYPDNLAYILNNAVDPVIVAKEISDFLAELSKQYDWYFVADPASFDWAWLNDLYDRFGPANKTYLGYKAICMDGMEKALHYCGYTMKDIVDAMTPPDCYGLKMDHLAVNDASYQAYGYLALLKLCKNIRDNYGEEDGGPEYICRPVTWIARWCDPNISDCCNNSEWRVNSQNQAIKLLLEFCKKNGLPSDRDEVLTKSLKEEGREEYTSENGPEAVQISVQHCNWLYV